MTTTRHFIDLFEKDKNNGKLYLEQALKVNDGDHDAWIELGDLFKEQRKARSAIRCYAKAVESEPIDPVTWTNMGNLAKKLKDYKNACEYFSRALDHNSLDTEALHGRRESYRHLGNLELAHKDDENFKELQKALQGENKAGGERADEEVYEDD